MPSSSRPSKAPGGWAKDVDLPVANITATDGSATTTITDINSNDDTVTVGATSGGVSAAVPVVFDFIGTGTGTGGGNVLQFTHTPTPIVADGSTEATITVSLTDSSTPPVPQQGQLITLQRSSTTAQITSQNPVQTDASGVATFTVVDTVAETVTLTASGGGATSINVSQTFFEVPVATVILAAPQVAGKLADGSDTYTLIAQVLDANSQPLAGRQVIFSASGYTGLVAMGVPVGTTQANGTVQTTITDINANDDTVTMSATSGGVTSATVNLNFTGTGSGTGAIIDILSFTHTPTPVVADGSTTANIEVTLTDSSTPPVPKQGELITLSSNSTTAQITSQNPVQTDASGIATFTVVNTVPENIILTASGGIATDVTVSQTFFEVPVASVVLAAPQVAGMLADGTESYEVIALVLDASSQPLGGRQVSFAASGYSGLVAFTPFGTTGTDGTVSTIVTNINANDDTVDMDATSGGVSTLSPVTLYFTGTGSGTGGGNILSFTHVPAPVLADGSSTATITARLTDASER